MVNMLTEFCPENSSDWRRWLSKNHIQEDAIWLVLHKKSSPAYNLSWSEAVDEALCYGWIDSTKKTIDQNKYKQYFSKRKEKSNWSKVNKEKIKTLINQGLMQEAGYKSIAIAKENGSWDILNDVENLILPSDLKKALSHAQNTLSFYEGLSKSKKKILLHWVSSAKRPETREKRILEIVENASLKQLPKAFK